MPSIVDLIEYLEPIASATACGDILNRFLDTPGQDLMVVVDGPRPVGVVCRAALKGHDDAKPAAALMIPPVIVQPNMDVAAACAQVLTCRDPTPGLVVVQDGRYLGVVTTRVLLRHEHDRARSTEEVHRFAEMLGQTLRSPLNDVLAVGELLKRQPLSADAQAYVRAILESGEGALRALSDAVELTSGDGELVLTLTPTLLRDVMDEVQTTWQARAAEDGVTLLVAYDGEPELSAMIDAGRMKQVFDKLIDTALAINRKGVVEASLHAARSPEGLQLVGRVRDTGGGLSVADLSSATPGSGLALCLRIVAAMNGTIRTDRNAGVGATIVFECPADPAVISTCDPVADMGGVKRTAHVLVVDDNATNRMVAEALCEMFDCTSECVENGLEAVEVAETGRFDLVLMDIRMPRMDGVEATKAIRALPGAAGKVPIIALTANADVEDVKSYIDAGMQCVVEKPLKPERLLQAMNTVLGDPTPQAAAA